MASSSSDSTQHEVADRNAFRAAHTKEERQKVNQELLSKMIAPPPQPSKKLSLVRLDVDFNMDALPSTLKNFPSVGMFPDKLLTSLAMIKRTVIEDAVNFVLQQETTNRMLEMRDCDSSVIVETKKIPIPQTKWFQYNAFIGNRCFGKVYDAQQWTLSRCGKENVSYNVFFFHEEDRYQSYVSRVDPKHPDKHETIFGLMQASVQHLINRFNQQ
jgi:hypothetical protein